MLAEKALIFFIVNYNECLLYLLDYLYKEVKVDPKLIILKKLSEGKLCKKNFNASIAFSNGFPLIEPLLSSRKMNSLLENFK